MSTAFGKSFSDSFVGSGVTNTTGYNPWASVVFPVEAALAAENAANNPNHNLAGDLDPNSLSRTVSLDPWADQFYGAQLNTTDLMRMTSLPVPAPLPLPQTDTKPTPKLPTVDLEVAKRGLNHAYSLFSYFVESEEHRQRQDIVSSQYERVSLMLDMAPEGLFSKSQLAKLSTETYRGMLSDGRGGAPGNPPQAPATFRQSESKKGTKLKPAEPFIPSAQREGVVKPSGSERAAFLQSPQGLATAQMQAQQVAMNTHTQFGMQRLEQFMKTMQQQSAPVCLDYLKGVCGHKRSKCKFAHPALPAHAEGEGSQICALWVLTGYCKFGDKCRDLHPTLNSQPDPSKMLQQMQSGMFALPLMWDAEALKRSAEVSKAATELTTTSKSPQGSK